MNKSKKLCWLEIERLYIDKKLQPRQILTELHANKHFDPNIIPGIQVLYYYMSNRGWTKRRKESVEELKTLQTELTSLKQKLQKKRFVKARDEIVEAFKSDELSIDDVTYEKIASLRVMLNELVNDANKKENGQINVDKMSKVVKLLDTFANTLIKARILNDKPTGKIDIEVKETLLDKMRDSYLDETVSEIEEDLKEPDKE